MKIMTQHRQWIMIAGFAVLITVCMVIYSEQSFNAAVAGLKIWWEVVFPALLPFVLLCELLMGLGVVHAMGVLLEPLMRPLFRVPGVGAFAFAMGLASGYPIGAKITGDLRRQNLCSRVEAERLLSFTNTADPLFMVGAVAVGMFKNPALGVTIAGAHYISSILLGFIMRFYGRKEERGRVVEEVEERQEGNIFMRAIERLLEARANDGRSFSELLGDVIRDSVNTMLLIGGFIILFSVLTQILTSVGVVAILTKMILAILAPFGIVESMVLPIIGGLFEITNGANLAANAVAPLTQKVAICGAIIAWSGLSVHAQAATMVQGTDIRMRTYVWARVLHAILAGICTLFLLNPAQTVLAPLTQLPGIFNQSVYSLGFLDRFGYLAYNFVIILGLMLLLSGIVALIRRIRIIVMKV